MSKIADAVVVIGKSQDGANIYRTVGALFTAENSSKGPGYFLRLDKSFNPAGALSARHDDPSITVSFYFPSEKAPIKRSTAGAKAPSGFDDMDDDISF